MEDRIVVLKFGGTSLADADGFAHVAGVVAAWRKKEQVAVVVSAMSGVTDRLLHFTHPDATASPTERDAEVTVARYRDVLSALPLTHQSRMPALFGFEALQFSRLMRRRPSDESVHDAWRASVVAYGEVFSAIVLAAALDSRGFLDAEFVDARGMIVTDSRYMAASVLPWAAERVQRVIGPYVTLGQTPIIPGFIAQNEVGQTTLLDRGGSDLTATLVGRAMNAAVVILYKNDVAGVMTGDPRSVAGARVLGDISYEDAADLAAYGGKVLHPRAVAMLVDKGIPAEVRHTAHPEKPGTTIQTWSSKNRERLATAVSSLPIGIVRISGSGMRDEVGLAGRVFAAAARQKVSVVSFGQSATESHIWLAVRRHEAPQLLTALKEDFRRELDYKRIEDISCDKEKAIVAVIGDALEKKPGLVRAAAALERAGIGYAGGSEFGPRRNIYCIVDARDADAALQALHDAFRLGKKEK